MEKGTNENLEKHDKSFGNIEIDSDSGNRGCWFSASV